MRKEKFDDDVDVEASNDRTAVSAMGGQAPVVELKLGTNTDCGENEIGKIQC